MQNRTVIGVQPGPVRVPFYQTVTILFLDPVKHDQNKYPQMNLV